eukprot:TRINITY_DN8850_c0_g1_i1.p1 TRINITY_DN8850_c0_g1~~TRINITY_DN8850_c0_g1_i1.p1  ORF type:complete len:508 (+),score=95.91 TRINITY_DN8850_c0_g1_i1:11-1534(+)
MIIRTRIRRSTRRKHNYRRKTNTINTRQYTNFIKKSTIPLVATIATVSGGYLLYQLYQSYANPEIEDVLYSRSQVGEHDSLENGVWVTYKEGVYDVTEFVKLHKGGTEFLLGAAGGDIEAFWLYWNRHYQKDAESYLAPYRIGSLKDYKPISNYDPYANEPTRHKTQIPFLTKPYESECDTDAVSNDYYTPVESFYIRNHAPVPNEVDHSDHLIGIKYGDQEKSISLQQLQQQYDQVNITSVMQCAGNRVGDMMDDNNQTINFERIGPGMIGNAKWTGVRLKDILTDLFPDAFQEDDMHVEFHGEDGYYSSSPLAYIKDSSRDAILAFKMNDQQLLPDHGYPVRVFIPGLVGARNVKWLNQINILDRRSTSPWMVTWYKKDSKVIQKSVPIQGIIMTKTLGEDGLVKGIAWGGCDGNLIDKVEISFDEGQSWVLAKLRVDEYEMNNNSSNWGWVRWEYLVPQSELSESINVWCRAFDVKGNHQEEFQFNPSGYLYNGYHRRNITTNK